MKIFFGLILVGLTIFKITEANAQIILGLKGGINLSSLALENEPSFKSSSRTAFGVGGFLRTPIGEKIKLQIEALYLGKGDKERQTANPSYKITNVFTYLAFPILVQYEMKTENLNSYLYVGPELCTLLDAYGDTPSGRSDDPKDNLKAGDFAVDIGAGVNFSKINLEIRYSIGILDIAKRPGQAFTRGIQFWVGIVP